MIAERIIKDYRLFKLIVDFCGNLGSTMGYYSINEYRWIDLHENAVLKALNNVVRIPDLETFELQSCRVMLIPSYDLVNIIYLIGYIVSPPTVKDRLNAEYAQNVLCVDSYVINTVRAIKVESLINLNNAQDTNRMYNRFATILGLVYNNVDDAVIAYGALIFKDIIDLRGDRARCVFNRFIRQFSDDLMARFLVYKMAVAKDKAAALFILKRVIAEFYPKYRCIFFE